MSRKRLGRMQRAATIVPVAVLSAAWTANMAAVGGISAPALAADGTTGTLADGTSVPSEAIEEPASVSNPGSVAGFEDGNEADVIGASSTNQIPSAALAAYQRAESVINSADKSCKLTWQLIAAIGRVESNHGRVDGNVLDDDGVATPGIYGAALNGEDNTQAIADTDGGQYDNDDTWDHAVGPMQFIPSTWSVVGVDADGDGQRNPQDIDDAALATAVYLCSGEDDLSTVAGQRAAVYRYNNSDTYVDLVLKIMNAYLEGDYSSVPNNSTAAGYIVPTSPSTSSYSGFDYSPSESADIDTDSDSSDTDSTDTDSTDTDSTDSGDSDSGSSDSDDSDSDAAAKAKDTVDKITGTVKDTVDSVDEGAGGVTSNLISGLLGPLTGAEAASACAAEYPKLTQTVKLVDCLLSYGLNP